MFTLTLTRPKHSKMDSCSKSPSHGKSPHQGWHEDNQNQVYLHTAMIFNITFSFLNITFHNADCSISPRNGGLDPTQFVVQAPPPTPIPSQPYSTLQHLEANASDLHWLRGHSGLQCSLLKTKQDLPLGEHVQASAVNVFLGPIMGVII